MADREVELLEAARVVMRGLDEPGELPTSYQREQQIVAEWRAAKARLRAAIDSYGVNPPSVLSPEQRTAGATLMICPTTKVLCLKGCKAAPCALGVLGRDGETFSGKTPMGRSDADQG